MEKSDETNAKVFIEDVIGDGLFGGVSAKSFREELEGLGDVENIELNINSPGGDVIDGFAIFNMLAEHPAKIHAKINGWAASMASIIAMAGDTVEMPNNAWFMIHNPWGMAMGESDDLRSLADVLDGMKKQAVRAYQRFNETDYDTISEWMDNETWMSGEDAQGLGFNFQFTDPIQAAACVSDFIDHDKVPEEAQQWLKQEDEDVSEEPEQPEASTEESPQDKLPGYEAGREVGKRERQAEIDEIKGQLESLNQQLADQKTEFEADLEAVKRERQSLKDQLAQLLPATGAPPLEGGVKTWHEALEECEGDYTEARRRYPQLYKQKREQDKQKRNQ